MLQHPVPQRQQHVMCCAGPSILQRPVRDDNASVGEHLLLGFAAALQTQPTCWWVAAAYLAWCPTHGEQTMAELLTHVPIQAVSNLKVQAALGS